MNDDMFGPHTKSLQKDDFKAGLLNTPDLRVREIQDLRQTALVMPAPLSLRRVLLSVVFFFF